jgi:hypothetical protein
MSLTKSAMLENAQASGYDIVKSKVMDHNTLSFISSDGASHVQLHNTVIFSRLPDDTLVLNTGKWKTVTTKDRLNKCLNRVTRELGYSHVSIGSINGMWYLYDGDNKIPFYDGMRFQLGNYSHLATESISKLNEVKALKKKLDAYIKACKEYLNTNKVFPMPNGGDCWYCSMVTTDGKSLGEAVSDTSHLVNHLDESYIFGSLVYNALKDCNAGQYWYSVAFDINQANYSGIEYRINQILCRFIRKYLKKRLGLA